VKTTIICRLQSSFKNKGLSSKHIFKPSLEKLNILPTVSIGNNPKTLSKIIKGNNRLKLQLTVFWCIHHVGIGLVEDASFHFNTQIKGKEY